LEVISSPSVRQVNGVSDFQFTNPRHATAEQADSDRTPLLFFSFNQNRYNPGASFRQSFSQIRTKQPLPSLRQKPNFGMLNLCPTMALQAFDKQEFLLIILDKYFAFVVNFTVFLLQTP